MSAADLAHPEWGETLLVLLCVSLSALVLGRGVARRRARRLLGPRGQGVPAGWMSDLALVGAALAIALALLGPRIGVRSEWVRSSGVDVVVLVDVSPSMTARDVPPSRLDRALEAAGQVLTGLSPGDRAALAVFSGRGVLLTPLTPDRTALRGMLPLLSPDLMQSRGSRIGEGLRAALGAFDEDRARPRSLLLLADGEDPDRGEVPGALLAREGVRVVAAAFGSESGASVPDGPRALTEGGRVVISRRQLEPLQRLAAATGGELLVADRWGRIDTERALARLGTDRATAPGERVERRIPATRVAPFAAAAFALLGLELALFRRRLFGSALRTAALAALLGAGALGAADLAPQDTHALLELGLARAESGEGREAARAFFAAAARARDPGLAALAYYDLGVAELESGRLTLARDAFYDALALDPTDLEARYNLEWTLRALASSPPQVPEPAGDRPPRPAQPSPAAPEESPAEAERAPEPDARDRGERQRPVPELSASEVERWLEQVPDEAAHALRDAARSPEGGTRPPRSAHPW